MSNTIQLIREILVFNIQPKDLDDLLEISLTLGLLFSCLWQHFYCAFEAQILILYYQKQKC